MQTMQNNSPFGPAAGATNSSKGPTIGAAIVVLVLVLGAVYYLWQKGGDDSEMYLGDAIPGAQDSGEPASDLITDQLLKQSVSDEVAAIESDLSATDLGNFSTGLESLEAELNLSETGN